MAIEDKLIIDLELTDSVKDSSNFPLDDGTQTYRATGKQLKEFVLGEELRKIQRMTTTQALLNTQPDCKAPADIAPHAIAYSTDYNIILGTKPNGGMLIRYLDSLNSDFLEASNPPSHIPFNIVYLDNDEVFLTAASPTFGDSDITFFKTEDGSSYYLPIVPVGIDRNINNWIYMKYFKETNKVMMYGYTYLGSASTSDLTNWTQYQFQSPNAAPYCHFKDIAYSPDDNLYVAVGEIMAGADSGGVVFTSEDGENWTPVKTHIQGVLISTITYDKNMKKFIVGSNNLYSFSNTPIYTLDESFNYIPLDDKVIRAGVYHSIYMDELECTVLAGGDSIFIVMDGKVSFSKNSGLEEIITICKVKNAVYLVTEGYGGGNIEKYALQRTMNMGL